MRSCAIMNFHTHHRYSVVTLSEAKGLSRRAERCFAPLSMTLPVLVVKTHYRAGLGRGRQSSSTLPQGAINGAPTPLNLTAKGRHILNLETAHMYIGVDIGGTSTRAGLFRSLDSPHFVPLARFPTHPDYEPQLQAIISAVQGSGTGPLAGIGVSIGGRMAKDGRSIAVAPNLPGYVGKPFAQDLSRALACPVRLAHDPVCGLLAEKKFGYVRDFDRCAYLTISTGTGAAIQLSKASTGLTISIEIGHQLLDGNSLPCLCGQVGCLETFTGGRQLELRYRQPVAQISSIDATFWETFCDKLALGLVNLAQLTRIEAIAISGSIALNNTFLLPLLQQRVNAKLRGASLELSLATLAENAPLVGAALLLDITEETILH